MLARALLAALALLAAPPGLLAAARAEIVHLPDGTLVHGRIVEFDEATGILLERADTGGRLRLGWEHLDPAEVSRLKASRGFTGEDPQPWLVDVVTLVLANGTTETGVLVEDGRGDVYTLKRRHGTESFPRQYVKAVEPGRADGLSAYTPDELYAVVLDERGAPGSAAGHFDLAVACEGASLHERALEHYTAAQQLDPAFRRELIAARVERTRTRIANRAETERLDAIRNRLHRNGFDEALAMVAEFRSAYPASTQLGELARLEADIGRRRREHYGRLSVPDYYSFLGRSLGEIARNPRMTVEAAQELLEGSVHEGIVERLAANYGMTTQEVEALWAERRAGSVRSAGYGTGTFILGAEKALARVGGKQEEEPAAKPGAAPADDLQARIEEVLAKRRAEAEKRAQASRAEKALEGGATPDEWWSRASADERARWLAAWYAESSGHLELLRAKFNDCRVCSGSGTVQGVNEKNEVITITCTTCKGLKLERVVSYR